MLRGFGHGARERRTRREIAGFRRVVRIALGAQAEDRKAIELRVEMAWVVAFGRRDVRDRAQHERGRNRKLPRERCDAEGSPRRTRGRAASL
jgi:hypothetical protein